jgi:hypothetical protein
VTAAPIRVRPLADVPLCEPDPDTALHVAATVGPGHAAATIVQAACLHCRQWYPTATPPRCWLRGTP